MVLCSYLLSACLFVPLVPLLCICVLLSHRNITSFHEQQFIPSNNLYGVSLVQMHYQNEVMAYT